MSRWLRMLCSQMAWGCVINRTFCLPENFQIPIDEALLVRGFELVLRRKVNA